MFRVEASLFYFNAEHVRDIVLEKISATRRTAEARGVRSVDFARRGPRRRAHAEGVARGTGRSRNTPAARSAHASVRDMLRAEGLEERVGYFGRRMSVADVIDEFLDEARIEIVPNGLSRSNSMALQRDGIN